MSATGKSASPAMSGAYPQRKTAVAHTGIKTSTIEIRKSPFIKNTIDHLLPND